MLRGSLAPAFGVESRDPIIARDVVCFTSDGGRGLGGNRDVNIGHINVESAIESKRSRAGGTLGRFRFGEALERRL